MAIENMMYFALGLLIAALFATILMPAMWQRAVRLTKKRIEAATPVSMAEFRAEKDQLRAEHAIAMRRMETTIETLRRRLANELRDTSRRSVEADLSAQRRAHQEIVAEFEAREDKLRRRALDVEKEVASLAQRLRMRERELEDKITELRALRAAQPAAASAPAPSAPPDVASPAPDPVEALHSKITGLEQSILKDWPDGRADEQALRTELISIAEDVAALPPPA
jgi:hypothetical protein